MSRAKSHWRKPPASDDFAELESTGGYEYGSPGSQSLSPFLQENEHNSKFKMARKVSTGTKSRRSSTADAEFEEDDQWNGYSDEDSKGKSRKKGDVADKLIKRRDQNRVSQRAFRQRKERHTKELEAKVEELENLLDAASHENSIVNSQMGRMEEELCYYRRLLFAGARQNRVPLSPPSSDTSGPISYTSNGQPYQVSRFNSSGGVQGHLTTPYLASYHSALAANSVTAIPSPLSTENTSTLFESYQYTPPSVDSCSTPEQSSARSCPPSPNSSAVFAPAHSSPNSPIITAPIPNHPSIGNFGTNVEGAFWQMEISGWNANDDSPSATAGTQGVPGYLQYMNTGSVGWTG